MLVVSAAISSIGCSMGSNRATGSRCRRCSGVREIRVREQGGAFRVIYAAKLADRVYVLHCFNKRTQKTARADLDLALKRYKQVVSEVQDRAGERT